MFSFLCFVEIRLSLYYVSVVLPIVRDWALIRNTRVNYKSAFCPTKNISLRKKKQQQQHAHTHANFFKNWLCPNFSCCPKNLSCPNLGGGAAAPPPPTPDSCAYALPYLPTCIRTYLLRTCSNTLYTLIHPGSMNLLTHIVNNLFRSHNILFISTRIPKVKSVLLCYWILKELMLSKERALTTIRSLLFLFCCPLCWFTIRLVFQRGKISPNWSILLLNLHLHWRLIKEFQITRVKN